MNPYPNSFYVPLPRGQQPTFFAEQRRLEREGPKPTTILDVAAIADVNNLALVYDLMKRENGRAPGLDRIRFEHLGRSELYGLLRTTNKAILAGIYRPGQAREVKIPKSGGRGFRTLTLRNLIDRVVAKAVNEALVPFWEKILLDGVHGYRPERSNWTLLAALKRAVEEQNRWVLVSDDVKNAFPSVNIDLVHESHLLYFAHDEKLVRLIETILRGGDATRKTGLDQGCPYMPVALNVHLHHVFDAQAHDLGDNPDHSTPWYRYADNLVVACQGVLEGQHVLERMVPRLQAAGLTLKGENDGHPVNLKQGGRVQLLGFILYRQGSRLRFKLGAGALSGLKKNLLHAHATNHPSEAAQAALVGWIDSYGPAFRKRQNRIVPYVLQLAAGYGFRELGSPDYYLSRCAGAYQRWCSLCNDQAGHGDD